MLGVTELTKKLNDLEPSLVTMGNNLAEVSSNLEDLKDVIYNLIEHIESCFDNYSFILDSNDETVIK